MYKIGIIGSDNSHAERFSQIMNIPDPKTGEFAFPDFKATAIFGLEKERTEQVARDGKIEFIAEKPEDFFGRVDAVMVVFRHGDLHLPYALPFIEAGIPTWIDKPFAIKNEDAKKLIEASKAHNTLLTGGSTCKYSYDVLTLKNVIEGGSRIGKIKTAMLSYRAELVNEYGGLYFYGPHLAEMTMAAFGYNPKSVIASESNGNIIAILKYDKYQVAMYFVPDSKEYCAVLHGENGMIHREINLEILYKLGFEKFAEMIRTRRLAEPLDHLYAPVQLLNAVIESYKTKTEISLV